MLAPISAKVARNLEEKKIPGWGVWYDEATDVTRMFPAVHVTVAVWVVTLPAVCEDWGGASLLLPFVLFISAYSSTLLQAIFSSIPITNGHDFEKLIHVFFASKGSRYIKYNYGYNYGHMHDVSKGWTSGSMDHPKIHLSQRSIYEITEKIYVWNWIINWYAIKNQELRTWNK